MVKLSDRVFDLFQTHVIDSVSEDGITVTLRDPLSYTHYGITETFEDGQFIDIRYAPC